MWHVLFAGLLVASLFLWLVAIACARGALRPLRGTWQDKWDQLTVDTLPLAATAVCATVVACIFTVAMIGVYRWYL